MTKSQYLKKAGWKNEGAVWKSPFTKFEYTEEAAMEVEYMLKGRDYIAAKMEIPESFERGVEDVKAGRVMRLDEALNEEPFEEPLG